MELTYEMAKELKPEFLVLHSGMTFDTKKWGLEELWLEKTTNFWREEIKKYEKEGIKILIENLVEEEPENLIKLCDSIDSDFFAICLDTGHLNLFSRISLSDWVIELGDRLNYIHLHDNNGNKDEHLPVGKGNIDFKSFFQTLKDSEKSAEVALELDAPPEVKMQNLRKVRKQYEK